MAKVTQAVQALERAEIDFTLHSYELTEDADTYGEAVAAELGVAPERLFKTLLAEVDGAPVVAIVPVSARLSMKELARAAGGKKAHMLPPSDAERLTGYVTGGISPFGQRRRIPVYVDETVSLFDTVYCSAGRRGLQVEIPPSSFTQLLRATSAPLADG